MQQASMRFTLPASTPRAQPLAIHMGMAVKEPRKDRPSPEVERSRRRRSLFQQSRRSTHRHDTAVPHRYGLG